MPLPQIQLGPFVFSSGYNPKEIKGPDRNVYAVEHQIPAREGGITEYVGSEQPKYQLRGFISPPDAGPFTGTAGAIVSGTGYVGLNADNAMSFLQGMRGSGAHLLRVESTATQTSGYPILYENGFFYIDKETWGFEAGKTYPYYPYGIDLKGASVKNYGASAPATTTTFSGEVGRYFSGYVYGYYLSGFGNTPSGATVTMTKGEFVVAMGMHAKSVASGNLRLAIYDVSGNLIVQSASQAVHSGWNYFPLNPSTTTTSGQGYILAMMSDATSRSGWAVSFVNDGSTSGTAFFISGQIFNSGFPATVGISVSGYTQVSGTDLAIVLVTT